MILHFLYSTMEVKIDFQTSVLKQRIWKDQYYKYNSQLIDVMSDAESINVTHEGKYTQLSCRTNIHQTDIRVQCITMDAGFAKFSKLLPEGRKQQIKEDRCYRVFIEIITPQIANKTSAYYWKTF